MASHHLRSEGIQTPSSSAARQDHRGPYITPRPRATRSAWPVAMMSSACLAEAITRPSWSDRPSSGGPFRRMAPGSREQAGSPGAYRVHRRNVDIVASRRLDSAARRTVSSESPATLDPIKSPTAFPPPCPGGKHADCTEHFEREAMWFSRLPPYYPRARLLASGDMNLMQEISMPAVQLDHVETDPINSLRRGPELFQEPCEVVPGQLARFGARRVRSPIGDGASASPRTFLGDNGFPPAAGACMEPSRPRMPQLNAQFGGAHKCANREPSSGPASCRRTTYRRTWSDSGRRLTFVISVENQSEAAPSERLRPGASSASRVAAPSTAAYWHIGERRSGSTTSLRAWLSARTGHYS